MCGSTFAEGSEVSVAVMRHFETPKWNRKKRTYLYGEITGPTDWFYLWFCEYFTGDPDMNSSYKKPFSVRANSA